MSITNITTDNVVATVQQSRKYRYIYRPTIERIVQDVISRYPAKEVEKTVKRILHQMWGAYFQRPKFDELLKDAREKLNTKEGPKAILLPLLKLQTSTNERIPILEEFYQKIFEITGVPKTIIEPACGINALTYPWMDPTVHYTGFDVDREEINFINSLFQIFNLNQKAAVQLGDIFSDSPVPADVGLLFKVLPLLEHQQKGSSLTVLKKMQCPHLVVSYPTRSIAGKHKGMEKFYTDSFMKLVQNEPWTVTKLVFSTELVFIIQK